MLARAFPAWNIIYPSIIACLAGGITAIITYKNLRKHVLLGGIIFAILYWLSLAIIELVFTGWIANTWNMSTLTSITIAGVPVEEIVFGFAFGTLWAPLYEETCSNLGVH